MKNLIGLFLIVILIGCGSGIRTISESLEACQMLEAKTPVWITNTRGRTIYADSKGVWIKQYPNDYAQVFDTEILIEPHCTVIISKTVDRVDYWIPHPWEFEDDNEGNGNNGGSGGWGWSPSPWVPSPFPYPTPTPSPTSTSVWGS